MPPTGRPPELVPPTLLGARARKRVLTLVCAAQFLVLLDVSVVNVALPSIATDLHFSSSGLQWVVNAYTVTFAGFLLLGGQLGDVLDHRRVFAGGLLVLGAASVAGGLAQTDGQLTAARAFQGLGGAIVAPITLTILTTTFQGAGRRKALAVWNAAGGAGGALGGIVGGVLTQTLGWRWVLFVNVPVVVGALLATVTIAYAPIRLGRSSLDLPSALTATAGLATITYAVVEANRYGWGSAHTVAWAGGGLTLVALFLLRQHRRRDSALLPLRLLRSRPLAVASGVMALGGATFLAMWFFLSVYLQQARGFSSVMTGLLFLPMGFGIITGSILSAALTSRWGARRTTVGGLLLAAAGFVVLSQVTSDAQGTALAVAGGTLAAFGVGSSFPPLTAVATHAAGDGNPGLVSGLLSTSRQLGGCLGLATLTTVASAVVDGPGRDAVTAGAARAFAAAAIIATCATALALALPRTTHDELEVGNR